MSVNKKILIYSFLVYLFLINNAYSQDNSPANPSSSYNNEYFSKDEKLIENKPIVIPTNTQIVVQGNNRLDSSVIIRDSLIDSNKTKPKDLSIAIKNLYKTNFFRNISLRLENQILYLEVEENPIIGNLEIIGIKKQSLIEFIKNKMRLAEMKSFDQELLSADIDLIKKFSKKKRDQFNSRLIYLLKRYRKDLKLK